MKLFKSLIILAVIALSFFGCNKVENVPDSIVRFSESIGNWDPGQGDYYSISMELDPIPIENSSIHISVFGINPQLYISTEPSMVQNEIILAIEAGTKFVSFTVFPDIENFPTGISEIEFELYYLGKGLNAPPFEGRFFSLFIEKPVEEEPEEYSPPYLEDFSNCSGESLPTGWVEEIVMQNNLQSSRWLCHGGGIEINAFVGASDDTSYSEVWLLSPMINLSGTANPSLSFDIDRRFNPEDPDLVPYDMVISKNYNRDNFSNAIWEQFHAGVDAINTNDPNADQYSNSGALDLSAFTGETITIAFIYRAGSVGTVDATIMRITNFSVL